MTYPDFTALTQAPEAVGCPAPDSPALPPIADPILLRALTEEELVQDEATAEPLVKVTGFGLQALNAYWDTGMRGTMPDMLIRRSVGERLLRVQARLPEGFTLALFDAYRPLVLQRRLYGMAYDNPDLPQGFVAVPTENPLTPPAHATGGAVDLTLAWQGQPLALGTPFDAFTEEAAAAYLEGSSSPSAALRRVLHWAMAGEGFIPYRMEWWHYEYGTPRWAEVMDARPLYGQPTAVADD